MPSDHTEPHCFKQLAQTYMAHESARLSRDTLRRRQQDLRLHLLPFMGQTPLYDITAMLIRKLGYALEAKGLSTTQIDQVIVSLRVCLKFAVNKHWLNVLPWPKNKVVDNMAITTDMPVMSQLEFAGLYSDLLGDMSGRSSLR